MSIYSALGCCCPLRLWTRPWLHSMPTIKTADGISFVKQCGTSLARTLASAGITLEVGWEGDFGPSYVGASISSPLPCDFFVGH